MTLAATVIQNFGWKSNNNKKKHVWPNFVYGFGKSPFSGFAADSIAAMMAAVIDVMSWVVSPWKLYLQLESGPTCNKPATLEV